MLNIAMSPPALNGLMMNMCAVAGLAFMGICLDARSIFFSASTRPVGGTDNGCCARVGGELARAGDGRLDEHGRDGREDHHRQQRQADLGRRVVAPATAEEHGEPREVASIMIAAAPLPRPN